MHASLKSQRLHDIPAEPSVRLIYPAPPPLLRKLPRIDPDTYPDTRAQYKPFGRLDKDKTIVVFA